MAIELGASRGQHKEGDVASLTRLFKFRTKFTSPLHLNRPNPQRQSLLEIVQETGRRRGRCLVIDLHPILSGDNISCRKVLMNHPRKRPHIQRVDINLRQVERAKIVQGCLAGKRSAFDRLAFVG